MVDYHLASDGTNRRCVARLRSGPGCRNCANTNHHSSIVDLARNGGGLIARSDGAGNTRESLVTAFENHYTVATKNLTRSYDWEGNHIDYVSRQNKIRYHTDLPEGFKYETHGVKLHHGDVNEPLAWSVHNELATIINTSNIEWQRMPASDRRALINNSINRYFAMNRATPFGGFSNDIARFGRTQVNAQTQTSVAHFGEGFENEKPDVIVRQILRKVALMKTAGEHDFSEDFQQQFKRFSLEQGVDSKMGVSAASKNMSKAEAFAEKRLSRLKWLGKCNNGHEDHVSVQPKSPRVCMTCADNDEVVHINTYIRKAGR